MAYCLSPDVQVSDTYTQRLNLLSQLERHLVQARAKALADDEKAIASLSESCSTYNDLNLPRGPSQFRKHLDEELLTRHHLLAPSQYVYTQSEHHKAPQGISRHMVLLYTISVLIQLYIWIVLDSMLLSCIQCQCVQIACPCT